MSNNRNKILNFIEKQQYLFSNDGLTTKYIADSLGIKRPNVSAILNDLVEHGYLVKTNSRPVFYRIPEKVKAENKEYDFSELIGYDASMRKAIQLAKAAILYPSKSLNTVVVAEPGSGSSRFVDAMFSFALKSNVFCKDAPFVKIVCKNYEKSIASLNDILFGSNQHDDCLIRAKNGMLLIENFDILAANQQSRLLDMINDKFDESQDMPVIVFTCSPRYNLDLFQKIPIVIDLPSLKKRSQEEKLSFISLFFNLESVSSKRTIVVETDAVIALLISDFQYDVKELNYEIKAACANAYVRVVEDNHGEMYVNINDFNIDLNRVLLKRRQYDNEFIDMLRKKDTYIFNGTLIETDYSQSKLFNQVYDNIKKQYHNLTYNGLDRHGIENIINTYIKTLYRKYSYINAVSHQTQHNQLTKIVDKKIIQIVSDWLETCSHTLKRSFKESTFYGLCLHLNALISDSRKSSKMTNIHIQKIIEDFPSEYAETVQFVTKLESKFHISIDLQETIVIMMFIVEESIIEKENHPVLLYVLHGQNVASSLAQVTNDLARKNNVYGYDLDLLVDPKQAYQDIKKILININQGSGIIVIYDMGSIKNMMELLQDELNIDIRLVHIPITLIGIDIARKAGLETDIDNIYHEVITGINNTLTVTSQNKVIITLCHTGEGGAVELKRYIEKYSKLGFVIIPMNISNRHLIVREALNLRKTYQIHAFIGTFDPKLLGVPFIPINDIFSVDPTELDKVLLFEPVSSQNSQYDAVYEYLETEFKYTSITKLKMTLPKVIDDLNSIYNLSDDGKMGVFMHIASLIERKLQGEKHQKLKEKDKIIQVFQDDYKEIRRILKILEKTFCCIFSDSEIAIIIMMMRKI